MGRGRTRFSLGDKIAIVQEAFGQPAMVCKVAKRYGIDYRNIKKWRKLLDAEDIDRRAKMHRPVASINASVEGQDVWAHLRHYVEELREKSIAVSGSMLFHESRRLE